MTRLSAAIALINDSDSDGVNFLTREGKKKWRGEKRDTANKSNSFFFLSPLMLGVQISDHFVDWQTTGLSKQRWIKNRSCCNLEKWNQKKKIKRKLRLTTLQTQISGQSGASEVVCGYRCSKTRGQPSSAHCSGGSKWHPARRCELKSD